MSFPGADRTEKIAPDPIRVVFLGTPEFAVPVLRALHEAPFINVAFVVTQPDRPAGRGRHLTPSAVKSYALAQGLDIFQPERLRRDEVIARLVAARADLLVIAAYGQILRQAILDIPRKGCLNVHPSLLPRHRGASPIPAAILAGDRETGVTIMLTDRGMDTGPILTQRTVPLPRTVTTASLTPQLAEIGAALLLETIPGWIAGEIAPQAQDERAATHSRQFVKADGAIDWTKPAIDLERQIRALNPWPRAFTFARGKRLALLLAQATGDGDTLAPGVVESGPGRTLLVGTGAGSLRLDQVQPEGGREVSGPQFLGNNPGLLGTVLG